MHQQQSLFSCCSILFNSPLCSRRSQYRSYLTNWHGKIILMRHLQILDLWFTLIDFNDVRNQKGTRIRTPPRFLSFFILEHPTDNIQQIFDAFEEGLLIFLHAAVQLRSKRHWIFNAKMCLLLACFGYENSFSSQTAPPGHEGAAVLCFGPPGLQKWFANQPHSL